MHPELLRMLMKARQDEIERRVAAQVAPRIASWRVPRPGRRITLAVRAMSAGLTTGRRSVRQAPGGLTIESSVTPLHAAVEPSLSIGQVTASAVPHSRCA